MLKNVDWRSIFAVVVVLIYLAAMITGAMLIFNSNWTVWQKVVMMLLVLV